MFLFFMLPSFLFSDIKYYYETNDTIVTLYPVKRDLATLKKAPKDALRWYHNKDGILLGLKHSFYISTKEINTTIEDICSEFNLSLQKSYGHHIFKVDQNRTLNILRLINYINKSTGKLVAYPDFYKKAKRR